MRNQRKRVLGGVTAGALALTLGACSADGGTTDGEDGVDAADLESGMDGAMEDYGVGDTFVATEPVSISLLYRDHPNYPLDEDWLFFEHIEEQSNVTFDITTAPLSDYEQRRSLLIGAGDAPDVISVVYPGQEAQFVASGAILPLSDYVDLMPHFQDKVERWDLQDELETLRQEDGKFYMLPGLYEQLRYDYTVALRTDVLDELGLEEPGTWDEFRDVLQAIKDDRGGSYVFSDRWQGNALLNVASAQFGTIAGWGFGQGVVFDEDAGEYRYAGATDEYREMVEYFAGLVEDGLMDPESFTQEDDQAFAKLANEQSYAITTNAQELLGNRTTLETSLGAGNFELDKIRVPAGPEGDVMRGMRIENGFMVSSAAAEKPNFVATLQFLDWLFYSDEGLEFARWGVEGETFEREGDTRVLAEDVEFLGQNEGAPQHLQNDFGFFNGVFSLAHGSTRDLVLTHIPEEEVQWQEAMSDKEMLPPGPPWPMNEMEREQASLYQTALVDYTNQNTLAFITGQRSLDEWDAYVAELEGQNMTAYEDLVNGAYQRYQESNA
jgi:putative aldouronate transport system substrate-binding protein